MSGTGNKEDRLSAVFSVDLNVHPPADDYELVRVALLSNEVVALVVPGAGENSLAGGLVVNSLSCDSHSQ